MANMEAIRATLNYIRAHTNLWEQDSWAGVLEDGYDVRDLINMLREDPFHPACGVHGCMAGLAVMNNGYRPIIRVLNADGYYPHIGGVEYCQKVEDGPDGKLVGVGPEVTIKGKAAELFEISERTATRLFDGDNTFEDLQSAVDYIEATNADGDGHLSGWSRPSDDEDEDLDGDDYAPEPEPGDDDYEPDGEWCSACGAYH